MAASHAHLTPPSGDDSAKSVLFLSLYVLFLFASHYLQPNRSGVGLELPFNAMTWIPVSVAIGAGLYVISRDRKFHFTDLTMKLAVLVCLLVLPLFFSVTGQEAALDRMLGLTGGLLFFVSLQQFRLRDHERVVVLSLVVLAVWIELAIGWDRYLRSIGISLVGDRPAWAGAPHGIFQQRNVFASFIATGIVLSGYLLGFASGEFGKRFRCYFLVFLLLPVFGMHLLIEMTSRTGWLGLLVGIALVAPYLYRNASRMVSMAWGLAFVLGIALSWGVSFAGNSDPAILDKDLVTLEGLRQTHFPQTVEMILDKPLFGHGYGRFEAAYLNFTAEKYAAGEIADPGVMRLDHPHNELLFWAAEGGLYSLVLVLLAAWFVWQRVVALPLFHVLAVIGLLFPIVLHTQVEYPFYQSLPHWLIFVLFIYWVDRLSAEEKTLPVQSVLLPGISALLVPLLTSLFMVSTLHAGYLFARFDSGEEPNVAELARIVNPVVYSDKINWAIMSRLVLSAAVNNRPEQAQPYIQWAPDLLARKPRPNFYRFLILAYRVTGDEENLRRYQEEARYLFPDESFTLPDLESGTVAPVPFDALSR